MNCDDLCVTCRFVCEHQFLQCSSDLWNTTIRRDYLKSFLNICSSWNFLLFPEFESILSDRIKCACGWLRTNFKAYLKNRNGLPTFVISQRNIFLDLCQIRMFCPVTIWWEWFEIIFHQYLCLAKVKTKILNLIVWNSLSEIATNFFID